MTIDEAIAREREIAEEQRIDNENCEYKAEYGCKGCADYYSKTCIECAEEHEQLAEWLEELKELRELKSKLNINSQYRLYRIWQMMRQRCNNENAENYKYYGGRGIYVCNEWENDFSLFALWSFANGYNDNLTIDRIESNGNYEPSNCRWISKKEQMNNRSSNTKYTYDG